MTKFTDFVTVPLESPSVLATLIGGMVLFILLAPMMIEARSQTARLRQAMIYRHRAKLRANSLMRLRASKLLYGNSLPLRLAKAFAILPSNVKIESQRLLRAAGYCSPHAVIVFWAVKVVFLIITTLGLLFIYVFLPPQIGSPGNSFTYLTILGIGFFLPDFLVCRQKKARQRTLSRSLPDGLDLLVICAEAGLSLDASLKRVADEFVSVVPELSEELLLTSVELNFLPDRRQALTNLGNRVELPAFRGVVATLIQTEKYGTPLAQALRALASEFRENRLLTAEEKASRLPAILTVPMIIFILPALFIILAAPAFIQVSEKFF